MGCPCEHNDHTFSHHQRPIEQERIHETLRVMWCKIFSILDITISLRVKTQYRHHDVFCSVTKVIINIWVQTFSDVGRAYYKSPSKMHSFNFLFLMSLWRFSRKEITYFCSKSGAITYNMITKDRTVGIFHRHIIIICLWYQQKYFLITGNAISLHMLSENYSQSLSQGR